MYKHCLKVWTAKELPDINGNVNTITILILSLHFEIKKRLMY